MLFIPQGRVWTESRVSWDSGVNGHDNERSYDKFDRIRTRLDMKYLLVVS